LRFLTEPVCSAQSVDPPSLAGVDHEGGGPPLLRSGIGRRERYFSCTHAGCHCHADPPVLHGPYIQWSRKVAGKTTSRTLSPEQVADYQEWFDNKRRLRALVHELEELSLSIVDADPRTPRRH